MKQKNQTTDSKLQSQNKKTKWMFLWVAIMLWVANVQAQTVMQHEPQFARSCVPAKLMNTSNSRTMTLESEIVHSGVQKEEPQFAKDRVLVKLANIPEMRATATGPKISQLSPDLGIAFSEVRLLNPSKGNVSVTNFSTMNVNDKQNNVYVLTIEDTAIDAVERALEILNANPAVEIAEPVFYYKLYATPNDPRSSAQYALERINAQQAWNITTGSQSIVVGIIDSGIDGTHPDLSNNLWVNPNPNQGGYMNDIHGYDFVYRRGGVPTDMGTHGTHVAGIVGAKGNNGTGIAGVNWDISLAWLGIGIDDYYVSTDAAIEALNYANNHNIRITNNSWGGDSYSALLEDAIRNYNGLFVVSAGNNGMNNDNNPYYPSNYNLPNVISVASTDRDDNLSSFSNYGANSVHIAAPGSDVLSTIVNAQYQEMSGTSMAAPHVAGVAALMLSVNPSSTAAHLKNTLINNADIITISTLTGETQKISRLNALKATQGILTTVRNLTYSTSGYNVTLNWQMPVDATGLLGYRVYREDTLLTPVNISALTYTDSNVPNGIFTYTVVAEYSNGQTASNSIPVTAGYVITIATQPVANTLVMHGSITGSLSVVATVTQNIPLSYQWYRNTTYSNEGGTPISGATNSTFNIPATLTPGIYYYFCELRAKGATSVRSNVATVGVAGIGEVPYLDENGNIQNVDAKNLTGTETTLTSGWYFVPDNITYPDRLTISTPDNGIVVIILGDGTYMNASNGGINVGEGNNLRIYAQSTGTSMGELIAIGSVDQAGIGGDAQSAGGTMSIYGGVITALGGGPNSGGGRNGGAGIGGGGGNYSSDGSAFGWSGGNINILGGIVSAYGSWGSSGIGCGGGSWDNTEGIISITGGTVTANGGGFGGYGIAGGTIGVISSNAVLISSSMDNENSILPALPTGKNLTSAIIYNNGMGIMYGDVILARDVTTPWGSNLFICNGQTLTIQEDYKLINNGTIVVNGGSVEGTVIGNQPIAPVFTISGDLAYDYSCSGVLTITGDGTYTIGMIGATTTTAERIVVLPGVNADITLSDVNIDMSSNTGLSAFDMTGSTVNLTLIGTNVLISGANRAGVEAPFGSTLVITEASTGSLTVTGGNYGAGIGGRGGAWTIGTATCGNINIKGGMVTSTGGFAGAGIGNGQGGVNTAVINILGGTITATGGIDGAGIGGGQADDSSNLEINISGGTVTAVGTSGSGAAPGIGASVIPNITINISGGETTSTGGSNSVGIGGGGFYGIFGGIFGQGATINITGGVVNAKRGGAGSAHDIGVSVVDDVTVLSNTNIIITGGSVFAANNLITDRWSDGITRYPVKATVVEANGTTKVNEAEVTYDGVYTATTGSNYTDTNFDTLDQGVAWLWLPVGSQTLNASTDTNNGSNTVNVLTFEENNITIALSSNFSICTHPLSSQTMYSNNITGNLNIEVCGIDPILVGYQWYINTNNSNTDGMPISNAMSSTFAIPTNLEAGTYYYFCEVKATSGVIMRSKVSKVTVVDMAGIEDMNNYSSFRVYPNPTDGKLIIESGELIIENVEIFDVFGKLQKFEPIQTEVKKSEIDVSYLSAGVYLLKAAGKTMKFVKK